MSGIVRVGCVARFLALLTALANPLPLCAQDNADSGPSRALEAPSDTRPQREKFWWSDEWFEKGLLAVPANHEVIQREVSYANLADKTEVPALLFRPKTPGTYPAILFVHGRRGIDDLTTRLPLRLAARGFVVLAPNLYAARFIEAMPVAHDPATEMDVGAGLDFLLSLPDVSTTRACLASHTRGGYYTLMAAVAQKRQGRQAVCYVSYYPHWQDPRAGEADQVYRYAGEVDRLEIPALIMMGEFEQYQRRRSIEMGVAALKAKQRDVRLIIYPGVGRGFDFRGPQVRTFADDLATKDSIMRAAEFMESHLRRHTKR
ncbi:MAG: dienelactone hydrolase [Hyphomicrobiaceae bacterium]|nr:MAG: dienelactone hydrolase [Hyphomicrobiaceae bacterium]